MGLTIFLLQELKLIFKAREIWLFSFLLKGFVLQYLGKEKWTLWDF